MAKSRKPARIYTKPNPAKAQPKPQASAQAQRQTPPVADPQPQEEVGRKRRRKPKSTRASLIELGVIVAVAIGLAFLIQALIVKPYQIPSGSMEPTLKVGQRVLVNRIGRGSPSVGDITVFHPPLNAENEACGPSERHVKLGGAPCDETALTHEPSVVFIKRIVAGPGDEIYVSEGHVYRKAAGTTSFVREHDSYIKQCKPLRVTEVQRAAPLEPLHFTSECNFTTPIKVPPGHWFMMGDNRGGSDDSRFWGPVPTSWIIGVAFFTYWPPDRIGSL